jgi:signal peptidase I
MEDIVRTADASSESAAPGLLQTIVFGRRPGWTLARVVFWVAALLLVSRFVLLPVRVQGISMMPTYRESAVNAINRLAYLRASPTRGDVVAIRYSGHHIMLLKRVIALPGETIGFVNGTAFVNGQPLQEPYLKLPSTWNVPEVKLAPDEYFVVGDNRSMAPEDHEFGRASRERIVGKAVF